MSFECFLNMALLGVFAAHSGHRTIHSRSAVEHFATPQPIRSIRGHQPVGQFLLPIDVSRDGIARGGMIAIFHIALPDAEDRSAVLFVVQIKDAQRRSAGWRTCDDVDQVTRPGEMQFPAIVSGMVEGNRQARFRVGALDAIPSAFIAIPTGQCKIDEVV